EKKEMIDMNEDIESLREGRHMYSVMASQFRTLEKIHRLIGNYLVSLNSIKNEFKDCDLSKTENLDEMIKIMKSQDNFQRDFVLSINANIEPLFNYYERISNQNDLKKMIKNIREINEEKLISIIKNREETKKDVS
ncbi:hypothetical protein ACQKFH_11480, partial [Staphylococcus warneri]|uniref:hypothetical protein n=1 Tax=Staphylococcus warneri TaxID=1292 RepID=UPI003D052066